MSNKSEATWHPNGGPEVPHADLIARLRKQGARAFTGRAGTGQDMLDAADALAALGNTVPREQYDSIGRLLAAREDEAHQNWSQADDAKRERDEARAERDALAHVIEQAPHAPGCGHVDWDADGLLRLGDCTCWKSTAPAVSLALHDELVKAKALDEAAEVFDKRDEDAAWVHRWLTNRAAAIREEAK